LLDHLDGDGTISIKQGEGFAFYALYPECYLEAASRSRLTSNTVVIGLRSIGINLAALVAAALGSGPAFSLRPTGHPFQRRIEVSAALSDRILSDADRDFAVVDEGPGLSGSSFASVLDWLEGHGVARNKIHLFPSHAGEPGAEASASNRERWRARPRHVVSVDDVIIRSSAPGCGLRKWVGQLIDEERHAWADVSGGSWRSVCYPVDGQWPPSATQMEKRKFLVQSRGGSWLAKFAGLSEAGASKIRRGGLLSEAEFTPKIIGACYGFTVEAWSRAPADVMTLGRDAIVGRIADYLSFRAEYMPALNGGASLTELRDMAVLNVEEACGGEVGSKLRKRIGNPDKLDHRVRRIDSDNRLHAWEWLVTTDGRLLKTDALDHNCAHDPIGCQDIAWDVAGAAVEFELSKSERDALAASVSQAAGCDLRDDLLSAFEAFYAAFQIGLWTMARGSVSAEERDRIDILLRRYVRRIEAMLAD
jgi:hypothetical protein